MKTPMIYSNQIHPCFQNEDYICAAAMMYRSREITLQVSSSCTLVHSRKEQWQVGVLGD